MIVIITFPHHLTQKASQALAYIEFDPSKERLSFVNFNVSLSRNILLLGVSGKKGKKDLVGQVLCLNKKNNG